MLHLGLHLLLVTRCGPSYKQKAEERFTPIVDTLHNSLPELAGLQYKKHVLSLVELASPDVSA